MEPGLALQFITGLPREMPLSFYFTGDSPRREPQLKRLPFPPASPERRAMAGRPVLRHNSTGVGAFSER